MADKRRIKVITRRVKPTTYKRNGKTIHRKGYTMKLKDVVGQKLGFKELSEKVAESYKGKKVPAKYQKLYGKRYSKDEAMEVGKKVAAKVRQGIFKKRHAKLKV